MINRTIGNLILICLLVLSGCIIPSVEKPIGTAWGPRETQRLVGTWKLLQSKDNFAVEFVADGELRIGIMSWNKGKKKFEAETSEVFVTHLENCDFLFIGSNEIETEHGAKYGVLLIESVEQDKIVLRTADEKQFLAAIREKKLTGRLIEDETEKPTAMVITGNAEEVAKSINEIGLERLFPKPKKETDQLVLVRIR